MFPWEAVRGPGVGWPVPSPDGHHFAFVRGGLLVLGDFADPSRRRYLTPTTLGLSTGTEYGGATYTFSPDGKVVFFSAAGKLHAVATADSQIVELLELDAHGVCYAPAVASDNSCLLFIAEVPTQCGIGRLELPAGYAENLSLLAGVEPVRVPVPCTFNYDLWSNGGTMCMQTWSAPHMAWNDSAIEVWSDAATQRHVVRAKSADLVQHCCQPRVSPNGKWLSFLSDASGWLNVWLAPLDAPCAARTVQLVHEDAEVFWDSWRAGSSFYCWLSDDTLVYARFVDAASVLVRVDIEWSVASSPHARAKTVLPLPKGLYADLHAVPGQPERLMCTYSCHNTREQICLVTGLTAGKTASHVLCGSEPEMPAETKAHFVAPTHITYSTGDDGDVAAHALLYRPRPTVPVRGCLVWVHGGPTGCSHDVFAIHIQYFVMQGWVVCAPNYRGSRGYGRAYREALNGNWGVYDVADSVATLRHLCNEGIVDQNRCAVFGASAGGFTSLHCALDLNQPWRACMAICPVADLRGLDLDSHLLERHYNATLIGPSTEAYVERSPVHLVKNRGAVRCKPLLIVTGVDDAVVPPQQSRDLLQALGHSPTVELLEFPGHHMFFLNPYNTPRILAAFDRFLAAHVP